MFFTVNIRFSAEHRALIHNAISAAIPLPYLVRFWNRSLDFFLSDSLHARMAAARLCH